MFTGDMLCTNLYDDVMAELKTWYSHAKLMAAPRKNMNYRKITQKHLFNAVVSSLDMLKQ